MTRKCLGTVRLCILSLVFFAFLAIKSSPILAAKPNTVLKTSLSSGSQEWAMRHRDATMRAATSELILPPLAQLWTKSFPYSGSLMDVPPRYVAADGKLFVTLRSADQTKSLLAIDLQTGTELWTKGFFNGYHFGDVAYDETTERLYAATYYDVIAVNPDDGSLLNQFALPNGGTYLSVSDGNLYVATDDTLSKFDRNGTLLWRYTDTRQNHGYAIPAVANGIVYMASGSWTLQAFNADTGQKIWESPTNGAPYTPPVVGDGLVLQGCQGQGAYSPVVLAYDAFTGQIKWGVQTGYGGTVWTAMSYSDGVLYFGSNDQNIYAVDTRTPRLLWSYETPDDISSPVVQMGNLVYAVSGCGTAGGLNALLYVLDVATGAFVSQETVPCSSGGLVPYQGTLILNGWSSTPGMLLKAYSTHEGYQMAVMPNQVSARPGDQAQTQLKISSTFHFAETVQLSASSPPNGITLSLSASQSPPSGTITVTLSLSPTLSLRGNIPITLTGTTAQVQKLAAMQLIVFDPLPLPKNIFLPFILR